MKRGEIHWYTFRLPDKRRPVLILTRNQVINRLSEIILSKKVKIEAPFYDEGRKVFEFDVEGLNWDAPRDLL